MLVWFHPTLDGTDEAPRHARDLKDPFLFAVQLLLGLPLFYLLTFAGHEEETEVEIGAMCATISVALGILTEGNSHYQTAVVIVPVLLYLWYTFRVLPHLRSLQAHTARLRP